VLSDGGEFASHGATLVAIGPLKEKVDQEINSNYTEREKYIQRHHFVPPKTPEPGSLHTKDESGRAEKS